MRAASLSWIFGFLVCPTPQHHAGLSAFGCAIEQWRREQGLTQKVTAQLIGISQSSLSSWVRKGQLPDSVYAAVRISTLMQRNLENLLEEDAGLKALLEPENVREMIVGMAAPRELRRFLEQQELLDEGQRLVQRSPHPGGRIAT